MALNLKSEHCRRCGQRTRNFWRDDQGAFSPWCNFCVAAQVLSYIGAARFQSVIALFTRAIDSGTEEDVRRVSLALRGLSTMIHDAGGPPEGPTSR